MSRAASKYERVFALRWRAVNGPELIRELRFDHRRRWRFDFAHLPTRTAIELEGGQWSSGRHTRGSGFAADCEKYNAAAMQGWAVFRLTEKMITVPWCECLADWIADRTHGQPLAAPADEASGNAERLLSEVRELVANPLNARLAAAFWAGTFALAWDNRKRRLLTEATA